MEQNKSFINELLPVLTSGNTGVWIYDTASGQLDFKNDFFEILGLARWSIKFSTLDELRSLIHADDQLVFDEAFAAASAGKKKSVLYRCCVGLKKMPLESLLMPCENGVIACTLNKDPALQPEYLGKQYKTLINALFPNFIFVFNDNFFFEDIITPDGVRLFHDNEKLIGSDARNLYSPEVSSLFISNIRECLKTKQWKEIEFPIDLFGVIYHYQVRLVPVEDNKVLCLNMDIGDRIRRMDELLAQRRRAEESDKMKSVFVANMSHEINMPLNAIIGFSEYLMNEEDSQKRQKYMDVVRNSTNLLLQIINDILDLSRLEAGMGEFKIEKTDIIALVMEVAEVYIPEMPPGVRLLMDIPDGNIQIPTDANRVKQVLFNFISNAKKHTEKGSITLKVEENNEYLTFSVADTGCGIPEDKLEVIFNRFEKLNRHVQGTGLGLAICKFIVNQLGGNITVTSKVNEGTVFSFTIPYQYVAPQKESIGSMRELAANLRKKVLLAETSETDLQFIIHALTNKYDVIEVTDSEKIINAFILENPNLVLISKEIVDKTDHIIRRIRAISATIPIILMTTSDFYYDQRWAIDNGCTSAISKPFSASNIKELVATFII